MIPMMRIVLIASLLAPCACTPLPRDNPSIVTNLRILGIQSEPAEVAPGATVTLRALVVDPGRTRPIEYNWYLCTALLLSELEIDDPFFTADACADDENLEWISSETELVFDVPAELTDTLSVPLVLRVRAGGNAHIALKRVDLSETPANHNPVVSGLLLDGNQPPPGQLYPLPGGERISLSPVVADAGDDDYPFVEFFVTGGEVDCDDFVFRDCNVAYAFDNFGGTLEYDFKQWKLPTRRGGEFEVHAVARDSLGGTDWRSHIVVIE